ncbi:flagellar motor switch protein FliM [Ramlibacter sp. RBP-2]|uniref:Flagellar motor switch protein FliM n=1 Tax=Ramlibacter lithotrophicus TaxID=2606681 RepID=A0A7X6I699_9BURK|nr:flagellar motor switch protein FliM [Ramlibacter lithotrophicus]NKE66158.1 flagellar motor switch protein FliM [Ramlibacter lithotrophicus]
MAYQQVLSQEEVDALLNGVTGDSAAAAAAPAAPEDGLPVYDLGSHARVVRGRMQTLELINERFARHLRGGLLNFMRRSPDITNGGFQVQQYGDFIRHLPVPANINMLHMKPLRGTGLVVFDPKLVFLVVDNLFGSDGRYHMRIEGRDFTRTEQRIIKRLLDMALECYGEAWKPVLPLEFEYIRSEMHGRLANIVAPNEVVVTSTLQIEFGPVGGFVHVCLPYSMLEPLRHLLANPIQSDAMEVDKRWVRQMARQVHSADVELAVEFVRIHATVGELLHLRKGDVLPIELPQRVTALVERTPVLQGRYGTSGGHYAVSVEQVFHHALEDRLEND